MTEIKIKTHLKLTKLEINLNNDNLKATGAIIVDSKLPPHNGYGTYEFTVPLTSELIEYVSNNIEKYMGETITHKDEERY